MSSIYGIATNGIYTFSQVQNQNMAQVNSETTQLESSTDPTAMQKLNDELVQANTNLTYALNVAGLFLKVIQPPF